MSDEATYWDDMPAPVREMRDNYIRAHGLAMLAVAGAPTDGTTLEDYVRALRTERDRLRAGNDELAETSTRQLHILLRLDTTLGSESPPDRRDAPSTVATIIAERDRLRAALHAAIGYLEGERITPDVIVSLRDALAMGNAAGEGT